MLRVHLLAMNEAGLVELVLLPRRAALKSVVCLVRCQIRKATDNNMAWKFKMIHYQPTRIVHWKTQDKSKFTEGV